MSVREKIASLVADGLSPAEISKMTGFNYKTVYCAMHPEMYEKKKVEPPVERPKGWNKNKKACKTCKYRGTNPGKTVYIRETSRNGCDFICMTGHRRGCKVEDCNRYVKGKRIRINTKGGWNEGMGKDE